MVDFLYADMIKYQQIEVLFLFLLPHLSVTTIVDAMMEREDDRDPTCIIHPTPTQQLLAPTSRCDEC